MAIDFANLEADITPICGWKVVSKQILTGRAVVAGREIIYTDRVCGWWWEGHLEGKGAVRMLEWRC